MIYVILEAESQSLLKEFHETDFQVELVNSGQGPNLITEASRVPIDVLILDINTGPGLGAAVLRYRLNRPDTRIILLAEDTFPGNAEVARVVQAGVYDVITDIKKLPEVLKEEPARLDVAAKWLDPELSPDTKELKENKVIEKIIERKVAICQRPVYIGVCGTAPGVGTTMAACIISCFLANQKYKTILIENGEPSLDIITGLDLSEPKPWFPYLDVCRNETPREFIKARKWQYVVVDLSEKKPQEIVDDFDLLFAVIPPLSRFSRARSWFNINRDNITYIVVGKKRETNDISKAWIYTNDDMSKKMKIEIVNKENSESWPPYSDIMMGQCSKLLAEVLPDKPRSSFRFKLPFVSCKSEYK
ncbi:MAG: hypothetical protein APF76_04880 [Desulfitibacter sp. BRH_c19]|nr:MAG: hypothetical protein APF76_04880 [Desulfitibacter sp. BRH_c19]